MAEPYDSKSRPSTPRGLAGDSSGVWSGLGEPRSAAALFRLGFDWVCLDLQHGRFDDASMGLTLSLTAADRPRTPAVVRVRANDPGLIGRALDSGASGVIVPMVGSPADAAAAVNATFYPPIGQRSWGPMEGGYGATPSPADEANAQTLCGVMIETASALAAVEQIAATPGVGMLFVGPFDLALALGTTVDGLLDEAATGAESGALRRIVAAAAAAGVVGGVFAGTPERAATFRELGFGFVAVATDVTLLERGSTAVLS